MAADIIFVSYSEKNLKDVLYKTLKWGVEDNLFLWVVHLIA